MRFLLASLSIVLSLAFAANADSITPQAAPVQLHSLLEIMNMHFQQSMDYLYTSKQYGSQYVERPGMAKLLMEASDFEWEQGLDFLKKFLQREGKVKTVLDKLAVTSSGQLSMSETNDERFEKYAGTFDILIDDAQNIFKKMSDAHSAPITSASPTVFDYEIAHYLDDKLEKKAARIYELKNHQTTLSKMKDVGIAVDAFDASL